MRSKTLPGSILPSRTSGRSSSTYARTGAGPAAHGDVAEERRLRGGHGLFLGHADATDRPTRTRDAYRRLRRLAVADALQHGVGAEEAAGELAHALHSLLAPLAHHVRRAELPRQRYPVFVAAQEDDMLGTQALGGDYPAKAHD